MGRETILFKSEQRHSLAEAANLLRQIADRLETGSITLRQGGEELTLAVPATLTVELKAEEEEERQGLKRSLEIELEWREGASVSSGVEIA